MSEPSADLRFPSFADSTATRVRPRFTADGHGNLEPDWSSPALLPLTGCLFAPTGTQEDNTHRSGVLHQGTLYVPGTPDVVASDAIDYAGIRYGVDGDPQRWGHTVIQLRKWKG